MDLTIQNKTSSNLKKLNIFFAKYINIFSIVIIILILLFGGYFLLWDKYRYIRQGTDSAVKEKKQENEDMNNLLNKLNKYSIAYNNISAQDKQKIDFILPSDPKDVDIYAQLEKTIKDEGLILTSIKVSQEADKANSERAKKSKNVAEHTAKKVKTIEIELSVFGVDYKKTKKLLNILENNLRLYDIEKLSFSGNEQNASFKLNAYYFQ